MDLLCDSRLLYLLVLGYLNVGDLSNSFISQMHIISHCWVSQIHNENNEDSTQTYPNPLDTLFLISRQKSVFLTLLMT
ncbi:unnamed protein product [Brassica oleracea var. botrytis]